MRRREILKGLVTASLAPALPLSAWAVRAQGKALARRVRPSDPAWPKPADWGKLKEAVGGNLIEPHALFAACETAPEGTACVDVEKSIRNPFYIGGQPAGTEVSGWLDAWTPAPSAYAIKARRSIEVISPARNIRCRQRHAKSCPHYQCRTTTTYKFSELLRRLSLGDSLPALGFL